MKNWTIGKRIITNSAFLIALVMGLGLFTFNQLHNINRFKDIIVADCLPGLATIGDINDRVSANYILTLRLMQTDDKEAKKHFADQIQTNVLVINDLTNQYEKTVTMEEDRQLFAKAIAARAAYVAAFKGIVALSDESKNGEARAAVISTLQPAYDALAQTIDDLVAFNERNGRTAAEGITQAATHANRGLWTGLGVALVAGILFAGFIIVSTTRLLRTVAASLGSGADQVAAASSQVACASQQLAEGASEQAASLEETSASLEEMTSMVKRNADSAAKAKSIAAETRAAADVGSVDMEEMKAAMSEIKNSSSDVAKIVKDIDEIAFQTNILALNAAVEAARAGEAGAGFAVVADEVRNLAQRSAASAKATAEKIDDAIVKSERGVQISIKVAKSFEQIVTKSREVDQYVAEIATASREQAQGVSEVNSAVTQMDKVTQSNAASAEECASAAEELNSQAETVKESVHALQKLVDGGVRSSGAVTKHRVSPKVGRQPSAPAASAVRAVNLVRPKGRENDLPLSASKEFKDF